MPGTEVLHAVLDEWKAGIDAHDPRRVAAVFSTDALFQGLRPYSIGRDGVFAYYDGQPLGMTVNYRILEARPVGEGSVLGYLAAEFSFVDRDPIHLNVGVLVVRTDDGWRIVHYQAGPAI